MLTRISRHSKRDWVGSQLKSHSVSILMRLLKVRVWKQTPHNLLTAAAVAAVDTSTLRQLEAAFCRTSVTPLVNTPLSTGLVLFYLRTGRFLLISPANGLDSLWKYAQVYDKKF
ncbi:hypothetical protein RRG08_020377 [Elysia crispata]|uniref:Uncharacterized protein n=1 Tax=Elysia crispata TaxID=231223 RepID=A0AAE1DAT9_9GAST|nr:hypothetical protein RRG08_020377 [Elysia crispata]